MHYLQCGALLYKEIVVMGKSTEDMSNTADEELKYYDMLYEFACVVSKANEKSFEGETPKQIARILKKSAAAFYNLCMMDDTDQGRRLDQEKEQAASPEPKEEQQEKNLPERGMPANFLVIDSDGWGLCPVCSGRVLKVTATTRLENFPVYCKRCRADHLVNWWNATNQRIQYKRYINESYLRNQALKGTGLQSYRNSGSSATERVAMMFR